MTVTVNGTTGVSLSAPASVPQTALQSNVAGNGPAFSAFQSTGQSLVQSVLTKLQFQTKEFDTTNAFDNTTNFRFQPLVAGYYQVSGGVAMTTNGTNLVLVVYKNGGQFKFLQDSRTALAMTSGSCLVFLNGSTDYVELIAKQEAATQNAVAALSATYFQAFLARSA